MNDSILSTIKRLLGGNIEGNYFDDELVLDINSVLSILTQLGVGPKDGFVITKDGEEDWESYIGGRKDIEMVKTYIYAKVRLMFDPPTNSFLVDSMKKLCDEFEWRLNVAIETPANQE